MSTKRLTMMSRFVEGLCYLFNAARVADPT